LNRPPRKVSVFRASQGEKELLAIKIAIFLSLALHVELSPFISISFLARTPPVPSSND
jgi:hypothetical protein